MCLGLVHPRAVINAQFMADLRPQSLVQDWILLVRFAYNCNDFVN